MAQPIHLLPQWVAIAGYGHLGLKKRIQQVLDRPEHEWFESAKKLAAEGEESVLEDAPQASNAHSVTDPAELADAGPETTPAN